METARETAKYATNTVLYPVRNTDANTVTDTANQATDVASDAAGKAVDGDTPGAGLVNSTINSFKPDPSMVWKGHAIYVILAAACTLPWWTFVCAVDYFEILYPDTHMIRYFPFVYYGPWLITFLLVAAFWREGSSWVKINVGVGIAIAVFVVLAIVDGVVIESHGTTATFWVTLVAVAIAGAADAISHGSLMGIASELPDSFTKAFCCGSAASGLFIFIVRVILKASFSDTIKGLRIGGIIYFCIAALFMVLALSLFIYLHNMPVMSYYNSMNLGSFETVRLLIQQQDVVSIEVASGAAIAAVAAGRSSPAQPLTWAPVLNRVKLLAIAMFVTSCVTLVIFPGVLAETVYWEGIGDWSPLIFIGTYIVCDVLGRLYLETHTSVPVKHSTIFGTAWVRVGLIGLFVIALLFDPGSFILMMVLTAILGFSNGYLMTALTILIPKSNPSNEAETAGILNAFIMNLGVLAGAGLSWIFVIV